MARVAIASSSLALLLLAAPAGVGKTVDWSGTWVTDEGAMELEQKGDDVEGTYGRGGKVEGRCDGRTFEGTYEAGNVSGRVKLEIDEGGGSFAGKWILPEGDSGPWRGWKRDEEAESKPTANFTGHWLTSIGTMVIEQKGSGQAEGLWGNAGWGKVTGEVKGRRLEATLRRPSWTGPVWLEQTPDGKRIYGLTSETPPSAVRGV